MLGGRAQRVAVITGAASGIGFALAQRALDDEMKVALVDVDETALDEARRALDRAPDARVRAYAVDVSDRAAVDQLATRVDGELGDVSLLVNNAGVFVAGPFLASTPEQWEFMLGVNLWGVVHGLRAFLPGMVARDAGHIVNTSSVDGLVTVPNAAAYNASKHAVTALSETLHRELEAAGSSVRVSVLCPGAVATDIVRSTRHWPARLGPAPATPDGAYPELDGVLGPAAVAEMTFDGIDAGRFWILTHAEQYAPAIRARAEGIVRSANPDDATVDPNFNRASGRRPGG